MDYSRHRQGYLDAMTGKPEDARLGEKSQSYVSGYDKGKMARIESLAKTPDTVAECYRRAETGEGPHEITEAAYWECLECMPPVYGPNGRKWIGEASDHRNGRAIALEYWQERDRYFCRLSMVPEGAAL
jgi:hypothetical protein